MNIFTQIKNSVYNKEYYQFTVLNQSLRSSIKYLAKLTLLLSLLAVMIFAVSLPRLLTTAKSAITSTVADYPDDLIVTLKDGNVSINKPEPYIVKMPDNFKGIENKETTKADNLIVVNTTEPFSMDKFKSYGTYVLLTKTEVVSVQPTTGEIKISSLSKVKNIEITKAWILEKEASLLKLLPWIVSIIIPIAYVGIYIGIFVATLIFLLLSAVIVWLIFKIKKINLSYKKSYQVALHASTIILIYSMISVYLGPLNNSLFKLVIFVAVILANFAGYKLVQKEEPIVPIESIETNNQ